MQGKLGNLTGGYSSFVTLGGSGGGVGGGDEKKKPSIGGIFFWNNPF